MDVVGRECKPEPERLNLIREIYALMPPPRRHRWVRVAAFPALDPRLDPLTALLDELGHTGPPVSTS